MNILDPPNWRWQRVVELVDDKATPSRNDEDIIVRTWRFLKRKKVASVMRMTTLKKDYPDIFAANKMYEDESDFRWLLEAALCTEAKIEDIAKDFQLDVVAIETYEKLFWDVRAHLGSPPYVEANILRPALRNRTLQENSPDYIRKFYALTLGYNSFLNSLKPDNESVEQIRFEALAYSNHVRQLSLEAAKNASAVGFNQVEMIKLAPEQEQKKEDRTTIQTAAVDAVKELMETVTFRRRALDAQITLDEHGRESRLSDPE